MLRYAGRWEQFIDAISQSDEVIKDQWEFEVQCRVLRRTGVERLIFLTDGIDSERLSGYSVTPAQSLVGDGGPQEVMDRLVAHLHRNNPDATWGVVPVGPYLLPRIAAPVAV